MLYFPLAKNHCCWLIFSRNSLQWSSAATVSACLHRKMLSVYDYMISNRTETMPRGFSAFRSAPPVMLHCRIIVSLPQSEAKGSLRIFTSSNYSKFPALAKTNITKIALRKALLLLFGKHTTLLWISAITTSSMCKGVKCGSWLYSRSLIRLFSRLRFLNRNNCSDWGYTPCSDIPRTVYRETCMPHNCLVHDHISKRVNRCLTPTVQLRYSARKLLGSQYMGTVRLLLIAIMSQTFLDFHGRRSMAMKYMCEQRDIYI